MLHCEAAIYLKELPPFLVTTYKAVNSGGGFPGVSNSAFSLEVAFQVFILLTSLTAASSSIMRGYCGVTTLHRSLYSSDVMHEALHSF